MTNGFLNNDFSADGNIVSGGTVTCDDISVDNIVMSGNSIGTTSGNLSMEPSGRLITPSIQLGPSFELELEDGSNDLFQTGRLNSRQCQFVYLSISGDDVDIRRVYTMAHEAFGGAGFRRLVADLRDIDNNVNFTLNSISVDSDAYFIIDATIASGTFVARARAFNIGHTYVTILEPTR